MCLCVWCVCVVCVRGMCVCAWYVCVCACVTNMSGVWSSCRVECVYVLVCRVCGLCGMRVVVVCVCVCVCVVILLCDDVAVWSADGCLLRACPIVYLKDTICWRGT